MNARAKGRRGELAAVQFLQGAIDRAGVADLVDAPQRRLNASRDGGHDLTLADMWGVELKTGTGGHAAWRRQCVRQAEAEKLLPLLLWKRNRGKWRTTKGTLPA